MKVQFPNWRAKLKPWSFPTTLLVLLSHLFQTSTIMTSSQSFTQNLFLWGLGYIVEGLGGDAWDEDEPWPFFMYRSSLLETVQFPQCQNFEHMHCWPSPLPAFCMNLRLWVVFLQISLCELSRSAFYPPSRHYQCTTKFISRILLCYLL